MFICTYGRSLSKCVWLELHVYRYEKGFEKFVCNFVDLCNKTDASQLDRSAV